MIEKKTDDAYQLGAWVGRKQAFAALAGRCSAADAECLRQIRNQKQYRALNLNWSQFCKQRVGVSHVTVDKLIGRLEEFGPAYFILAQATGITPEQYRRIQGSVRGQALLHAGEEIPINAENPPRLAAAVEELRRGPGVGQAAGGGAEKGAASGAAEIKAAPARRIFYRDPETERPLAFLTNHLDLPALTIAELYRCRWRVELFFKWIKQHLRIKAFYGCSENAVKTQIWIAIAVCVLVAIARKRLGINTSLYSLLQMLSLNLYEKTPIPDILQRSKNNTHPALSCNQLNLFDF